MRTYLALLGLVLAACSSDTAPATGRPAKPAAAPPGVSAPARPVPAAAQSLPAAWPAPFKATYTGCIRVARHAATILARPLANAAKFGQLAVGDKLVLLARTADGWVGFDPGSAQAGNVGIFRLRWVRATEAFGPGANCQQLPLVQAPPPGCVLMAATDTPVHPHPAPGTARLGTIPAGSYAQVSKPSVGPANWAEVRVPGSAAPGYVTRQDINFNGDCQ